jgi:hypothetical protein
MKKMNFLQYAIQIIKTKKSANVGVEVGINAVQMSLFEAEKNISSASAEHSLSYGGAQ